MVKVKWKGHTLEMYDSIQELPITRYQMYNLNVLIDSGIGSDLAGTDTRCNNIRRLMTTDKEQADQEITNLQQNIRFIMSKTSPELNSFAVMIKKIDGRKVNDSDLTDEGIKDIIEELGRKRLLMSVVRDFLFATKKKIDFEFETFFPGVTDSAMVKELYTKLKQRTMLVLKSIRETSADIEEQIRQIDEFIMSKMKPKNFHGSSGMEVTMVKGFEQTCVMLKQYNVADNPKEMTTLSFYQAIEVIREQLKARKKK